MSQRTVIDGIVNSHARANEIEETQRCRGDVMIGVFVDVQHALLIAQRYAVVASGCQVTEVNNIACLL